MRDRRIAMQTILFHSARGEKSIHHRGAKLWNKLNDKLRNSESLNIFKSQYKVYLLENDENDEDDFFNSIFWFTSDLNNSPHLFFVFTLCAKLGLMGAFSTPCSTTTARLMRGINAIILYQRYFPLSNGWFYHIAVLIPDMQTTWLGKFSWCGSYYLLWILSPDLSLSY